MAIKLSMYAVQCKLPVLLTYNQEQTEFIVLLGNDIDDYDIALPIDVDNLAEAQEMTRTIADKMHAYFDRVMESAEIEEQHGPSISGAGLVH